MNGKFGTQTVVMGSMAPNQGGTVQNLLGNVSVYNLGTAVSNIVIDDTADTVGRNIKITSPLDQPIYTAISGLAPALLVTQTNPAPTSVYGARALRLYSGTGVDTLLIDRVGTGVTLNYNLGAGNDTVTVNAANSKLTLDGGSGNDNFNIGNGQTHWMLQS